MGKAMWRLSLSNPGDSRMEKIRFYADSSVSDIKLALLSRLTNQIPKMVWLSDHTGKRIFFSNRWLRFIGVSYRDVEGDGWKKIIHPEDRERVGTLIESAVATRQSFHIEYRMRRADGSFRQVLDSGSPEFGDDGRLFGFTGYCTDINETVHSSDQLSAFKMPSEKSQVDTHFNSPIAIWKLDREFRIEKVNPIAYEQLGSFDDIVGQKLSDIVPSITEEMLEDVLQAKSKLHVTCASVVLAKPKPGPAPNWTVAIWPVTDSNGVTNGVCVSSMEQDHLKSETVHEVVAALVHDLKSPLIGAEKTFEALLQGAAGTLDRDLENILEVLKRGNRSMLDMIQNLIEVQRNDGENVPRMIESTDVIEVVRATVNELGALASHNNIQLIDQLSRQPEILPVERTAIKRVFHNLISNAVKFTPKGGMIILTSKKSESELSISIADTGIGISKSDQKNLFKKYFQGERSRRRIDGSGLGLYLCKTIVERHGGTISVQSEEGAGSIFTITLPRDSKPIN
jgi:PAS domain S-box-containing protein